MTPKCCRDREIIFEQGEISITHVQLVPIFRMRISFPIQIANADDIFESLCAHRAGIHPQSSADRARNSFHPFQPADAGGPSGVGYFLQLGADSRSDFGAVDFDLIEITAAWVHHHATDAAVAHEQIRAAADDEKGKIFPTAKANQLRESVFIARLDPKLCRAAYTQRCVFQERFVKANLSIFAHDLR